MAYTEVQRRGQRKYYYLSKSLRRAGKVRKERRYLGANLSGRELKRLEQEAMRLFDKPLESVLTVSERKNLELAKRKHEKLPKETWQNRYERFLAQFTYDSNAIEGNTLSLQETSAVIFDNVTPEGKTPREINEAVNHKRAFDYMLGYDGELDKRFVCDLQRMVVANALRADLEAQSGKYRSVQVFIRGAAFMPPKPKDVPKEMRRLLSWHKRHKDNLHPLIAAAYFHAAFESIHPFVDGNGRTGRLLINFMLRQEGFPMANIPNSERLSYYRCLEEARKGSLRALVKLLYDKLMSTTHGI